jgi:hypothetical protein
VPHCGLNSVAAIMPQAMRSGKPRPDAPMPVFPLSGMNR